MADETGTARTPAIQVGAAATLGTTCCVVGGGPAGMMLGLLLARAGVDVVVLEKHADFLRDFRGDTIHPSTLELMSELGVLQEFLKLPHQEVPKLAAVVGGVEVEVADFSHLPTRCRFVAMIPQWDFLDFLAARAAAYPGFRLIRQAGVTDLVEDAGRVIGVRASTPDGPLEVRAGLVVGADGRSSVVRKRAGLAIRELGSPMDVLWFRLSRKPDDPVQSTGRFDLGRIFVVINRGEHWQLGYVISKGTREEIEARGLDAFRSDVAELVPFLADRVAEIAAWDDVKLLTVRVDRLRRWYRRGLLCIGDAAHAMSPVGGVGINLAIQDAVAAANILAPRLRAGRLSTADLARVQRRRQFPTRVTQAGQVLIQNRVIGAVLSGGVVRDPASAELALPLRLLDRFPALRRVVARVVGIGVRPEHVKTPQAS
ncbi:FAD-dependent oxidoreductase [Streptomyces sp. NPDC052309]|uniref:FAD-dependent oxidoreductase n=1 Tax=Streptomyces sp. NPDC052309 TaxID=3155421 RepID=UPI003413EF7F